MQPFARTQEGRWQQDAYLEETGLKAGECHTALQIQLLPGVYRQRFTLIRLSQLLLQRVWALSELMEAFLASGSQDAHHMHSRDIGAYWNCVRRALHEAAAVCNELGR